MRAWLAVAAICAVVTLHATDAGGTGPAPVLTGGAITYTVARGDTLRAIAARFGVYPSTIAADNQLDTRRVLEAGRPLRIDNHHIVPPLAPNELVVNVPQRMVFYLDVDGVRAYPIAVGRTTWKTPAGPFTVIRKEADPAWHVPESIRAESARKGETLPLVVPPGPKNPLGRFWIGLSLAGIGIHGTPFPSSIYQTSTHGCIRVQYDGIADLYSHVTVGTRGRIVYEPILVAASGGEVYIEAHPDVYQRLTVSPHQQARDLAARLGVAELIDWAKADEEIDRRAGVARSVSTARPAYPPAQTSGQS